MIRRASVCIWYLGNGRFYYEAKWPAENNERRENIRWLNEWRKFEIVTVKNKRLHWFEKHISIPWQPKMLLKNSGLKASAEILSEKASCQIIPIELLELSKCLHRKPERILTLIESGS